MKKKNGFKNSKTILKKLFQFATVGTHFMFKGKLYDQVDGVAMGSPLRPVLANLFMRYHGQKWLQSFEKCEVKLYHRHMDDIICLFNSECDAEFFLFFYVNGTPK